MEDEDTDLWYICKFCGRAFPAKELESFLAHKQATHPKELRKEKRKQRRFKKLLELENTIGGLKIEAGVEELGVDQFGLEKSFLHEDSVTETQGNGSLDVACSVPNSDGSINDNCKLKEVMDLRSCEDGGHELETDSPTNLVESLNSGFPESSGSEQELNEPLGMLMTGGKASSISIQKEEKFVEMILTNCSTTVEQNSQPKDDWSPSGDGENIQVERELDELTSLSEKTLEPGGILRNVIGFLVDTISGGVNFVLPNKPSVPVEIEEGVESGFSGPNTSDDQRATDVVTVMNVTEDVSTPTQNRIESESKDQESSYKSNLRNTKSKANRPFSKSMFKCNVCSKLFKTKAWLKRHENMMCRSSESSNPRHSQAYLKNKTMGKLIKSAKRFQIIFKLKRKFYQCKHCLKVFRMKKYSRDLIQVHIDQHKNQKPFYCSKCNIQFQTPWSRQRHEQIHKKKKLNLSCSACSRTFSTYWSHWQHLSRNEIETCIRCNVCSKIYIGKCALGVHYRREHNGNNGIEINNLEKTNSTISVPTRKSIRGISQSRVTKRLNFVSRIPERRSKRLSTQRNNEGETVKHKLLPQQPAPKIEGSQFTSKPEQVPDDYYFQIANPNSHDYCNELCPTEHKFICKRKSLFRKQASKERKSKEQAIVSQNKGGDLPGPQDGNCEVKNTKFPGIKSNIGFIDHCSSPQVGSDKR